MRMTPCGQTCNPPESDRRSDSRRRVLRVLALAPACVPGLLAAADEPQGVSDADATAIRAVIERQLAAFAEDDAETAFSLASPEIRQMFSTARNFMTMVQAEYAVVYRPASTMFADVRQADGRILQFVEMTDADGQMWHAIFHVARQDGGAWLIAGCILIRADAREAGVRDPVIAPG